MGFTKRTRALYSDEAVERFNNATVAVFGIGGVGGHAAESLVRCNVGNIIVCDRDVVDVTNINRQIVADTMTVGIPKVDIFQDRACKINPDVNIVKYMHSFDDDFYIVFEKYNVDYVLDCIDDVRAKINLICYCKEHNINIISSMGTALRLRPDKLEIKDVYKTEYDPLARVVRKELKSRGVKKLDVVCSAEEPQKRMGNDMGSSPFVPAAAGLIMAAFVADKLKNGNIDDRSKEDTVPY